jgi:hypothetical protein
MVGFSLNTLAKMDLQTRLNKWVKKREWNKENGSGYITFTVASIPHELDSNKHLTLVIDDTIHNLTSIIYDYRNDKFVTKDFYDMIFDQYSDIMYQIHKEFLQFYKWYSNYVKENKNNKTNVLNQYYNSYSERQNIVNVLEFYDVYKFFKFLITLPSSWFDASRITYCEVERNLDFYKSIPDKMSTLKNILERYEIYEPAYKLHRV